MDGRKGWWVVFGSVWALTITAGVGFFSMAVLAETIINETGWTEKEYAIGITIWGLTAALFSPFCGVAIDKFGSRPIMIAGIIVGSVAEFGLSRATESPQFYGTMCILALGVMSTTYIPIAAIVSHWFVKHEAIATGLAMLGLGIGGGAFPLITKSLLDGRGYEETFTLLAGIWLTALIPVAIWIKPPSEEARVAFNVEHDEDTQDDPARDLTLVQALKSRSFWGLSLGDLFTGMVFTIFNTLLVLYMTKDTGDADLATQVFSVLSFGLGFGIIVFGPLGEMFDFRKIFTLCYFLPAVATTLLVVSGSPTIAYSFAVIAGFAGGGRSALFPAAILKSFGGSHMASIYGFSNTLFMLGTATGPAIAVALYDATGKTSTIYLFGVVVFIISTFLVSLIRDERDFFSPKVKDTTHFILVRHGETTANRADIVGGSSDDSLTDTGHEQARKVGAYLKTKASAAVALYASPLSRAWDTASHIGDSLGMTPEKKEHLAEWYVGDWEGVKYTEIAERGEFDLTALASLDFRPPSGEALGEVQIRVLKSLREIAEKHPGEQVVVVSHGTALALALAELKGDDSGAWMEYRLENCSVSELILGVESEVICLNETSHL